MGNNVLKKFASCRIFHDQINVLVGLYYLVELGDVGVPHFPHDLHLPIKAHSIGLILYLRLLYYFDGHLLVSEPVLGDAHFAESPCPDLLPQYKIAEASLHGARVVAHLIVGIVRARHFAYALLCVLVLVYV